MEHVEPEREAAVVAAKLAATDAASLRRIELVEERRRVHDPAFRARVVAAALVPGARVEELARRLGICTSRIYRWRRAMSGPALRAPAVRLVPVRVAQAQAAEPRAAACRPAREAKRLGLVEIELDNGIRVRVDADVSVAALRRLVTALRG